MSTISSDVASARAPEHAGAVLESDGQHERTGFKYSILDHLSHFSGLAVAQFYLLCAAVTVYEVFMRYAFNAPTQWAFEMVMTLCACAWMISAGFVTLKQRHIGITVLYLMAPRRAQWWLDSIAMSVGILALFLLVADSLPHALRAIDGVQRVGSAFNSPQPMILKSILVVGGAMYLSQLLVNFHRHVRSRFGRLVIIAVAVLIAARLAATVLTHYAGATGLWGAVDQAYLALGSVFDPTAYINAREIGLGTFTVAVMAGLLILMMTGMPLGVVTLIVSVLCALLFFGPQGLYLVSTNSYGLLEQYPLVAVPLFVLMAALLERSGVAEDLFDAMSIFAGNMRGGVAVQTVAVAVVLAAMSGVVGGEIVMLGLVALPQLFRLGYDRKLSIGVICASGALATLIPPSIIMIVYGLSANVGIGDLFLAGVLPGILLAGSYAAYVVIRCQLNPKLAPTAAEVAEMTGSARMLTAHRKAAVALSIALIGCVMGSIYFGIASVTEAAGVGVVGAIFVAAVRNRFNWKLLQGALAGTMSTVGTIIWLILGAVSFVGIYNLIGGAEFLRSLFSEMGLPAIAVILVMMGILVVLGSFMEWIAIVFITVPVFAPVVVGLAPQLGLDPSWAAVWFGILFVMNMQIYFLSPPFGPACFWLKSVAPPDVTLQEIFVAVMPFIGLQILNVILVMIFPSIALFLPQLMSGAN